MPLGLVAYCGVLALGGHDPLAPFNAQEVWFRSFAGPFVGAWDGVVAAVQGARQLLSGAREPVYFTAAGGDPFVVARHNIELLVWLVLALVAVAGVLRRLPAAYGAYVVAALALPLSYPVGPQPLMSLPRFVAVLFPLAIWLALWMTGRAVRERLVVAAFAVGAGGLQRDLRDVALGRVGVVTLDALGTLVELERPAPRLAAELRARGVRVGEPQAAAALRAEIALLPRPPRQRAPTRRRWRCCASAAPRCCAGRSSARARDVGALAPAQLRDALLAALRFRPFDEVPAALAELRAAGHRLVVVSNWDVSLHEMLRTTGLAALVDGAVSSAEAGERKPAAGIFRRALAARRRGGRGDPPRCTPAIARARRRRCARAPACAPCSSRARARRRGPGGRAVLASLDGLRRSPRDLRAPRRLRRRRVTCSDDVRRAAPARARRRAHLACAARRPPASGRPSHRRCADVTAGRPGCRSSASSPASGRRSWSGSSSSSRRRRSASESDAPGINIGLTLVQNVALVGAALFFA